ncbi:hypothetical protein ACIPY6_28495 [Streptomyces sp. NPDC090054]|uniref:hypothetical protein n=1 Tax=Streptomyces sp. NPDC090054 TaxID=3365933 RepID=UPI0037FC6FF8
MTSRLPAHGTLYRYGGPKNGAWEACRCPKCVAFHSRACTLRAIARLKGEPPLYPAGPLVDHINLLLDSGMTYRLIATRARVARSTVSYLARGINKGCQRAKALRILAVRPADFDEVAERSVLGSERRVRALYAIGHGATAIAAAANLDTTTISYIANGHWKTINGRTAAAVREAYRHLAWRPGSSAPAKRRALRGGWDNPLAWGGDMDDPAARPERAEPSSVKAVSMRPDVEHLLRAGEAADAVCDRTGASSSYVRQIAAELSGKPRIRSHKTDMRKAA